MSENLIKKIFKLPPAHHSTHGFDHKNCNFEPVSWKNYYDTKRTITIRQNNFNVYVKGSTGPILFFIHGGGFSGLSWASLSNELVKLIGCRCYSVDMRGHGETQTENDDDLSIETLTSDLLDLIEQLFGKEIIHLDIVLVGHSMGGGVAIHVANQGAHIGLKYIAGIILIDVVEGTALDALSIMPSFLRSRPKYFDSLTKAIEWSVKSGQIKNVDSARVSVPGELKRVDPTSSEYKILIEDAQTSKGFAAKPRFESIPEDESIATNISSSSTNSMPKLPDESKFSKHVSDSNKSAIYTWRAQLGKSEKYWQGWFKGISKMFIELPIAKMIILAGVDHLDKELTIAQMQGKFQMVILAKCGHSVHEDLPDEVAQVIATFLVKQKMATISNPDALIFAPSC